MNSLNLILLPETLTNSPSQAASNVIFGHLDENCTTAILGQSATALKRVLQSAPETIRSSPMPRVHVALQAAVQDLRSRARIQNVNMENSEPSATQHQRNMEIFFAATDEKKLLKWQIMNSND